MKFYKKWGLAIAVLILAVGITFALRAQQKPPEKKYKVELTLDEWKHVFAAIEMAKNALKGSDVSSRDVVFINDSLFVKIQSSFANQINAQIASEQGASTILHDSTSNKAKKN